MARYLAAPDRYGSMAYRRVGASGVRLPAISLGLWQNFGGTDVFETERAQERRQLLHRQHVVAADVDATEQCYPGAHRP